MNNTPLIKNNQNEKQLSPEQLEEALADLKQGKSPRYFVGDQEFQAALQLHVLTSNTEIDPGFQKVLKNRLLEKQKAATQNQEQPRWWEVWKKHYLMPTLATTVVAVAILLVVVFLPKQQNNHTELAEVDKQNNNDTPAKTTEQNEQNEENNNNPVANNQNENTNINNNNNENNNNKNAEPNPEPESTAVVDEMAKVDLSTETIASLTQELETTVADTNNMEAELLAFTNSANSIESDVASLSNTVSNL
ncbi:MAG: hypothetical protein A2233_04995 [Candidatus Kerfeldbacteria bacterium RIFOXYA2_FULL_38_24]|uniref:Uncharacterized protein n=1 Tax=Candidatus Kerfeldbacteria bacterium RIFOXYB2_FULL_38_14 TaxID=1798547 RepID=A0A1G2B982_9BACT|nr:MAG: hypothetical protein A2233_04995 [Candidatus Kerfeldbacteria bacterium RIFOXYA2_FULL_38_24]OGY85682.1 MAG: hypothetical protein A2319_05265 [Candidatus Kerfeldbacteria bacterium RIFOXYB2_FULL_38_14]OGY88368.1 MAG: hypothetical protein A2458_02800 [Candidatus Kerfeldbacteria bacterium RIFOXYC2_FULL_38_9]